MGDLPQETPVPARERLLNAAEQVVAQSGVRNLTLEAVAQQAGVSKGGCSTTFRRNRRW
jgi:AcrR family transcriptional regulator